MEILIRIIRSIFLKYIYKKKSYTKLNSCYKHSYRMKRCKHSLLKFALRTGVAQTTSSLYSPYADQLIGLLYCKRSLLAPAVGKANFSKLCLHRSMRYESRVDLRLCYY